MLLDAGHIITGGTKHKMKVVACSINEKVYAALRIVASHRRLSMSHIARGWLQSVVEHHKNKTLDLSMFKNPSGIIIEGHTAHLSLPLSNGLIRELNSIKDAVGIKLSALVNTAIILGMKQYAQYYADPSLRAEIERTLFAGRDAGKPEENAA